MNVFKNPETAKDYDSYYNSEFGKKVDEIEKKVLSSVMKNMPRMHLLELGCGTGHWTKFFLQQGFQVTATDISEAMLNLAKEKELNAVFKKADAENLPFENNTFEAVAAVTMIEFVENQEKVFDEMYRVLQPGGRLVLGCLNAASVLAENSAQDPVFKEAQFLAPEQLREKLNRFGNPRFEYGVCLDSEFNIVDGSTDKKSAEPVFIAALVQKTR
ncbi:MAG: class I SAM-dependent methyltransferase [Prolixibacteraceae bacterium]